MKSIDEVGSTYGRLTVLKRTETSGKGRAKFLCRCSCGNETEVTGVYLRKGLVKSCGCYRKDFRLNGYDPAINDIYSVYKRDATRKDREFSLTKDELSKIVLAPCTYCGSPPSRAHRPTKLVTNLRFNGIDRKDNTVGYTTDNAQPCCSICNQAKHTLSEIDFLSWLDRAYNFLKEKQCL